MKHTYPSATQKIKKIKENKSNAESLPKLKKMFDEKSK